MAFVCTGGVALALPRLRGSLYRQPSYGAPKPSWRRTSGITVLISVLLGLAFLVAYLS